MYFVRCCANPDLTDNIDSEGIHHDVNVVNIDNCDLKVNRVNPTAYVKYFFKAAPHKSREYPAQETTVSRPTRRYNEGMKPLDNRRIVLACYEAFKLVSRPG